VGEDGAKDSQVSSGNRGVVDDGVLLPLHELGPARPVEPHPEPSAAGLLLHLGQRAGTCACDEAVVCGSIRRSGDPSGVGRLWRGPARGWRCGLLGAAARDGAAEGERRLTHYSCNR